MYGSFNHDYEKKMCEEKGLAMGKSLLQSSIEIVIQIGTAMNETSAKIAECPKPSLNNVFQRYMEDNGYNYRQNVLQFVTFLKSKKICLIDWKLKDVKNFDIFTIHRRKPL